MKGKKVRGILALLVAGTLLGGCKVQGMNEPEVIAPYPVDEEWTERIEKPVTDPKTEESEPSTQMEQTGQEEANRTGEQTGQGEVIRTGSRSGEEEIEVICGYPRNTENALYDFQMELFAQTMEQENALLSPLSVYFVLAMAGSGSEGDTRRELELGLGTDFERTASQYLQRFSDAEDRQYQLSLANAIWADDRLKMHDGWKDRMEQLFQGNMEQKRLSSYETMQEINQWCDRQTNGMIPKMIDEPLDDEARLALLNAIYLKAQWQRPFQETGTGPMDFTLESGETVTADMMRLMREDQEYFRLPYGEGVNLPYRGGDLSFVAIKPDEGISVRECFQQLKKEDLSAVLGTAEYVNMNLYLPKFEKECKTDLIKAVSTMGMGTIFSENADLSGIGYDQSGAGLYASELFQKAAIKVTEQGTEASAVTMMVVDKACAMIMEEEPLELKFDRSFLYMIVDRENNLPLFIGIMENPEA